jgi:hypothetical protein
MKTPRSDMLYPIIVALTWQEAKHLSRTLGLDPARWTYTTSTYGLGGAKGVVYLAESAEQLPDWGNVARVLGTNPNITIIPLGSEFA